MSWSLARVLFVLSLLVAVWCVQARAWCAPDAMPFIANNEGSRLALEYLRTSQERYLDMAVLIFAGLLGVAFVNEKTRLRRHDRGGILLVLLSCALVGSLMFIDWHHATLVQRAFWDLGPELSKTNELIDVLGWQSYTHSRVALIVALLSVATSAAITVVHLWLHGGDNNNA